MGYREIRKFDWMDDFALWLGIRAEKIANAFSSIS